MSYLINPVMFFTPILIAPFLYLFLSRNKMEQSKKQALKTTAIFLLVYLLIPSGWAIRNQLSVPPDSPNSSGRLLINMIIGSHSNYYDVYRQNPRNPENPADVDIRKIKGSSPLFLEIMKQRIISRPGHYAKWYFLKKPILLWDWNILMGQGDIYVYPVIALLYHKSLLVLASYSIMKSLHYWLVAFALLSIVFLVRKSDMSLERSVMIMIYITLFYISSVYIVSQSEARYSIPLRPEMYLCAVYFIAKVFLLINKKRHLAQEISDL